MPKQKFLPDDTISSLLNNGLNTGIKSNNIMNGLDQLSQSNLDRMLKRNNYFQQNAGQVLQDLGIQGQQNQQQSPIIPQPLAEKTQEEQLLAKKNLPSQQSKEQKMIEKEKIKEQREFEKEQKRIKLEDDKLNKIQEKERRGEQSAIDKETLPYYKDTLKAEKAAVSSDLRLSRMEELVEKGSLPISHFYRLFKNLSEADIGKTAPIVGPLAGLIVNPIINFIGGTLLAGQRSLTSTDTEEFEKLSNDFLKDVKDIFGARVTDGEVKRYLQTIPNLDQTDAGKMKVIRNLKSFNEIAKLRAKTMKDLIKENNGNRPKNLEILVDEKMAPILDEVALEFKLGTRAYPTF